MQRNKTFEEALVCAVTQEIFNDPVNIECGHSIEKDAANYLLEGPKEKCICPTCRAPFTKESVKPNFALKGIVDKYLADHPDAKSDQYVLGTYVREKTKDQKMASPPAGLSTHLQTQSAVPAIPPPTAPSQSLLASRVVRGPYIPREPLTPPPSPREELKDAKFTLPTFVVVTGEPKRREIPRSGPGLHQPPAVLSSKVLLLGDSDTQKPQFLLNMAEDKAQVPSFISTIGLDFRIVNIGNEKFRLWDTAGQERFRTITRSYYRGANLILIFGANAHDWVKEVLENYNPEQLKLFTPNYLNFRGHYVVSLRKLEKDVTLGPTEPKIVGRVDAREFGLHLLTNSSVYIKRPSEQEVQQAIELQLEQKPAQKCC